MSFHLRDGLFFSRLPDGSVKIDWHVEPNLQILSLTVPENEWASVVSSVSKEGETYERWIQARRFHGTDENNLTSK